jgi:rubrerythrin
MKTDKNLMDAFAGESQANRKYLAFAQKAEKEGYKNIARVLRAIAEAVTIHALKHQEVAGKVGSTLENLATAMDGEHYELDNGAAMRHFFCQL